MIIEIKNIGEVTRGKERLYVTYRAASLFNYLMS